MRILVGIGGTDDSFTALERTADRAVVAGDDLAIGVFDDPDAELSREEIETRAREILHDAGLDAEVRYLEGDAGSALVDFSEEGFDKIVIGGGKRSPMGKIKIDTVAEFVLLNAHVTVSLVRS